jgi:prepilin-type N-terminal cleavage/methylation domain-containing protein
MENPKPRRPDLAFTLIELLIVVAIIAILAAIAVPNFLEAQTRSKVARVQNDLRTLATAFESYAVDHNRPPVDMVEYAMTTGAAVQERWRCYALLTTPVAYLSSFIHDPFPAQAGVSDEQGVYRDEGKFYFYVNYVKFPAGGSRETAWCEPLRARGYLWSVYSCGPARVESQPWIEVMLLNPDAPESLGNVYDATNGTVSRGKIYRTNKGVLTGGNM